ncbi:CDGSH iron-sulfur domain-containing protein [Deinococcus yavapaiensis]|uniref:Putative Fe-S cluster protein YjdI n=1 Tax=Deinococcus yavapaiensis KR-236 TaxID=694435 RepID=A0A318S6D6_9DEIO|nr:CDGSH iron-sulfur domain-containing protein [Deinococcus yavapaiensis]PYE49950.1 putative Fe-S cluster protein YjdI [Deinococcus yavapaiensis KR-236]
MTPSTRHEFEVDLPVTPPGKAYEGNGVTVYYDARRCLHFAECVRGLPEVFDPSARPWIRAWLAEPSAVSEVVTRCPTGALHFTSQEGTELPESPTSITPLADGPLIVRGDFELRVPGTPLRETRAALCRCGQSGNKPFCDGTHAKVGWRSDGGDAHDEASNARGDV